MGRAPPFEKLWSSRFAMRRQTLTDNQFILRTGGVIVRILLLFVAMAMATVIVFSSFYLRQTNTSLA